MAIVRGQVFGDVSGKVAGMIFSRNATNKVVRSLSVKTPIKTPARLAVRSVYSDAVHEWRSISFDERLSWNFKASLLKSKCSGFCLFFKNYIQENPPMPVQPYSYFVKRVLTPVEIANLFYGAIDIVQSVPAPDFIFLRSYTVFCLNADYSLGASLNINYSGLSPMIGFNIDQGVPLSMCGSGIGLTDNTLTDGLLNLSLQVSAGVFIVPGSHASDVVITLECSNIPFNLA